MTNIIKEQKESEKIEFQKGILENLSKDYSKNYNELVDKNSEIA